MDNAAAPGVGSALKILLDRHAQNGSVLNQNSSNPDAVLPAQPPNAPSSGVPPVTQPSGVPQGTPQQPQAAASNQQPMGQPTAPVPQATPTPREENTSMVLKALTDYLDHSQNVTEQEAGLNNK